MNTAKTKTDIRDIVRAGVRPDRTTDNLKVYHQARGGLTAYAKKRVASIGAPMVRGAHARTIRIHELLHANNSPASMPRKFHPIANNAIEDIRVHAIYWPDSLPRRAHRDCLTTALLDLRRLPKFADMKTTDDWNISLLVAARTLAIVGRLQSYGRTRTKLDNIAKQLTATFPMSIVQALADIVGLAQGKRTINKARKAFQDLMRSDNPEDKQPGTAKGEKSNGAQSANPVRIITLPLVGRRKTANATLRCLTFGYLSRGL